MLFVLKRCSFLSNIVARARRNSGLVILGGVGSDITWYSFPAKLFAMEAIKLFFNH